MLTHAAASITSWSLQWCVCYICLQDATTIHPLSPHAHGYLPYAAHMSSCENARKSRAAIGAPPFFWKENEKREMTNQELAS